MTCIVGIQTGSGVWVGADSVSSNGWSMDLPGWDHKLFRAVWYGTRGQKHAYIAGGTATFRSLDLLRYGLPEKLRGIDPDSGNLRNWMVNTFIEKLRTLLAERDFLKKNGGEAVPGIFFLVALVGRLFRVQSDLSLLEVSDFDSVGSGSEVAYGSLLTSAALLPDKPKRRARLALKAAAQRCTTVAGPFNILKL